MPEGRGWSEDVLDGESAIGEERVASFGEVDAGSIGTDVDLGYVPGLVMDGGGIVEEVVFFVGGEVAGQERSGGTIFFEIGGRGTSSDEDDVGFHRADAIDHFAHDGVIGFALSGCGVVIGRGGGSVLETLLTANLIDEGGGEL